MDASLGNGVVARQVSAPVTVRAVESSAAATSLRNADAVSVALDPYRNTYLGAFHTDESWGRFIISFHDSFLLGENDKIAVALPRCHGEFHSFWPHLWLVRNTRYSHDGFDDLRRIGCRVSGVVDVGIRPETDK